LQFKCVHNKQDNGGAFEEPKSKVYRHLLESFGRFRRKLHFEDALKKLKNLDYWHLEATIKSANAQENLS